MEVIPRDRGQPTHLPERRDSIAGSVERALEGVPAPEVTPVQEALRKVQVPAPAPVTKRDASLGVEVNPRNREAQENVSSESTLF